MSKDKSMKVNPVKEAEKGPFVADYGPSWRNLVFSRVRNRLMVDEFDDRKTAFMFVRLLRKHDRTEARRLLALLSNGHWAPDEIGTEPPENYWALRKVDRIEEREE